MKKLTTFIVDENTMVKIVSPETVTALKESVKDNSDFQIVEANGKLYWVDKVESEFETKIAISNVRDTEVLNNND